MEVIKRNGTHVELNSARIRNAIVKANAEIEPVHQMNAAQIEAVVTKIQKEAETNAGKHTFSVEEIQNAIVPDIQEMRAYEVATHYTHASAET